MLTEYDGRKNSLLYSRKHFPERDLFCLHQRLGLSFEKEVRRINIVTAKVVAKGYIRFVLAKEKFISCLAKP